MDTVVAALPPKKLLRRGAIRRLLIIALLAEIGYAALNLSTMPIYLKEDRRFGEGVIGLVLTAFLLSEAAFKTPMGSLADRIGPRLLMVAGPAISFGTALLSFVVPRTGAGTSEVLLFVLLRSLDGVGIAMLWPAAFAQMNASVSDDERQQAMSLLNLCYMVGIALAFPVGGLANDSLGPAFARLGLGRASAGLVIAALLFLVVAAAAWVCVPAGRAAVHEHEEPKEGLGALAGAFREIPAYLLLASVTFMAIGFPTYVFKLFPIEQFGFSETQVGMLILPGALALAAGAVPMAKVGERLGRTRAVQLGLLTSAAGMGVIASGAFLPFVRTPLVLAVGGIPVGLGFLVAIPAWMASVADIHPARRGSNLGAVMTAQGLGAIVGAPLGALLYEKLQPVGRRAFGPGGEALGRYAPFVACAGALVLAWALSRRVLRRAPAPSAALDGLAEEAALLAASPSIETAIVGLDEAARPSDASNDRIR